MLYPVFSNKEKKEQFAHIVMWTYFTQAVVILLWACFF